MEWRDCTAKRYPYEAAPLRIWPAGLAARPSRARPIAVSLHASALAAALALLPGLPAVAAVALPVATAASTTTGSPRSGPLVIVGGGQRPPEALARFVQWAGGPSARLLVVPWASAEPRESCDSLLEELRAPLRVADVGGGGEASCAHFAPLDADGKASRLDDAAKASFLGQLATATGVFFTGGDQARIMDVLADRELLLAVRERHARGFVFGGTSAGAAVMSPQMITGDGDFTVIDGRQVVVREGLALLPGVIVDQHFVRRQRENRLFGLVLAHPELRGVGIDEDTALLVAAGGRHAEVVGRGPVLLVDAIGSDKLEVTILRTGQSVDLTPRRRR